MNGIQITTIKGFSVTLKHPNCHTVELMRNSFNKNYRVCIFMDFLGIDNIMLCDLLRATNHKLTNPEA